MSTMHTPTPWEVHGDRAIGTSEDDWQVIAYLDHHRNRRMWSPEEFQANAAFIVTACNAHDELMAVLKELREAIMDGLCNGGTPAFDGPERLDRAIVAADALLAKSTP